MKSKYVVIASAINVCCYFCSKDEIKGQKKSLEKKEAKRLQLFCKELNLDFGCVRL
jgi:hypothetical protein